MAGYGHIICHEVSILQYNTQPIWNGVLEGVYQARGLREDGEKEGGREERRS